MLGKYVKLNSTPDVSYLISPLSLNTAPEWNIIYPSGSVPQRSWNGRGIVLSRLENSARKHNKEVVAILINGLKNLQMS